MLQFINISVHVEIMIYILIGMTLHEDVHIVLVEYHQTTVAWCLLHVSILHAGKLMHAKIGIVRHGITRVLLMPGWCTIGT